MYDYSGDMEIFKRKLRAAGIDDQEHDIEDYAGFPLLNTPFLISLCFRNPHIHKII